MIKSSLNKMNRRSCLILLLFALSAFIPPTVTPGKKRVRKAETNDAKKKEANPRILKKEQIIVNLAADGLLIFPKWGGDINVISKKQIIKALNNYVDEYAGGQVTSIFFNVNYQRACFDSKVMTPYWDIPAGTEMTSWPVNAGKLHKRGIDMYKVYIDRSRAKKISPWISIRMNDHHYWDDSSKINRFAMTHPEYRLNGAMLNYEIKEVRDFYLAFIKEVLDRYDVDGIELDWVRTQTYFKKGTDMKSGSKILNDFMKEVRSMTNQNATERGHAVKIATRVLASPEINESYGLDGISWVKNGCTDILIPTNWHTPINFDLPIDVWKERIGNGHDYILAPCAELAYRCENDPYAKIINVDLESMRGFSTSVFSKGADAVYLFNHFFFDGFDRKVIKPNKSSYIVNDRLDILRETGSYETVKNKPRRHPLTYTEPQGLNQKITAYLPVKVRDNTASFNLYSGPVPVNGKYILIVGLQSLKGYNDAKLTVKVNGVEASPLSDLPRDPAYVYDSAKRKWDLVNNLAEVAARMLQFKVDPKVILPGYNTITIANARKDEQELIWLEAAID